MEKQITNWAEEFRMDWSCFTSFENMSYLNSRAGYHWFSKDTMRFFSCRLLDGIWANWQEKDNCHEFYFVTSEKHWDGPRLYTVRKFDSRTAQVDTIGEFQQYKTARAAKNAAKKLATKRFSNQAL